MPTKTGDLYFNWRFVTIIGTVIVAVFSSIAWLDTRIEDKFATKLALSGIEDRLQKKVDDATLLLHLRFSSIILENLETLEAELARATDNSPEVARTLRNRMKEIREETKDYMREYIQNE
ncbi:MAG: hypothetical protein QNJ81_06765 [Acidimicrobiia bacterium]|nr:hypothetical protein [Acidimicrobiia bacterium]